MLCATEQNLQVGDRVVCHPSNYHGVIQKIENGLVTIRISSGRDIRLPVRMCYRNDDDCLHEHDYWTM